MAWVKVYLYQILHDVHHRCHPGVPTRSHVDDLSQVAQGSADEVRRQLASAAVHLGHSLESVELILSD
eukprot:2097534-Pyramimonas_sp.AAC.1